MIFYASPAEEAGALRRAVVRAGCKLRSVKIGATAAGQRSLGEVECVDGWGAARLVMALAAEDAKTIGARTIARDLRRRAPSDRAFAGEVQGFVRRRIRFVPEVGEVFQGPGYALAMGQGDCEDHARAVYAIAVAGGLPARLAFLHRGDGPTHAVAQVLVDGQARWAETTVAAEFGEHPIEAARRLGLRHERGDISEEAVIMTEKDLAPVPAGFMRVNDPDQVKRDAQALERLGYLTCSERVMGDPTNLDFRRAVLAFQRAEKITQDGLVGPQTRRTIAGVLPLDEFGMGYVAATTSTVPALKYSSDVPDQFLIDLKRYAAELGMDPVWLIEVMLSESGIDSKAELPKRPRRLELAMIPRSERPRTSLASGLIGWMDITGFGYPDNSVESHMAFVDEVPLLKQLAAARSFWKNKQAVAKQYGRVIESAANLYQANFVPASLARGTSPETIIAAKDGTGYPGKDGKPQEPAFYKENAGYLDVDKDGAITVADMAARLTLNRKTNAGRFNELVQRLGGSLTPGDPSSGPGVAGAAVGVVVLVGLGLAAYHAWG